MRLRVQIGSAIFFLAAMSQATVLTFDVDGATNGVLLPQSYGETTSLPARWAASTTAPQAASRPT